MKFRCNWSIPHDNWLPVLKKFTSMSSHESGALSNSSAYSGEYALRFRDGVLTRD